MTQKPQSGPALCQALLCRGHQASPHPWGPQCNTEAVPQALLLCQQAAQSWAGYFSALASASSEVVAGLCWRHERDVGAAGSGRWHAGVLREGCAAARGLLLSLPSAETNRNPTWQPSLRPLHGKNRVEIVGSWQGPKASAQPPLILKSGSGVHRDARLGCSTRSGHRKHFSKGKQLPLQVAQPPPTPRGSGPPTAAYRGPTLACSHPDTPNTTGAAGSHGPGGRTARTVIFCSWPPRSWHLPRQLSYGSERCSLL